MPWRFLAFCLPLHFMALLAGYFVRSSRGRAGRPAPAPACRGRRRSAGLRCQPSSGHTWSSARACSVSCCWVASRYRGFSELDRTGSAARMADGAVLLVVKTFGIVVVVATLRWALGSRERRAMPRKRCCGSECRGAARSGRSQAVDNRCRGFGAVGAIGGVIALALFVATDSHLRLGSSPSCKYSACTAANQHQSVALG
jgi:hypothetical protein